MRREVEVVLPERLRVAVQVLREQALRSQAVVLPVRLPVREQALRNWDLEQIENHRNTHHQSKSHCHYRNPGSHQNY